MQVNITNPETQEEFIYYMDDKLRNFLNKIKETLEKHDRDYVMLIDGYEGAGKSTFGIQIGRYIDPSLSLDQICLTAEEFKQAIIHAKKNQCIIYDEAVTGLTAGDSITRVGKLLKSMMMQMRQKNLCVIVILPTIFELSKYVVFHRSKAFFHIYEVNNLRGYFVGYSKSDTRDVYLKGKKTYTYGRKSPFRGRFYGKLPLDDESYRAKKEKALFEVDDEEDANKKTILVDDLCYFAKKELNETIKGLDKRFRAYGIRTDVKTRVARAGRRRELG